MANKKQKGVYKSEGNPGYQKWLDGISFDRAFALMKDRTEKFEWRGKVYTTEMAEPQPQVKPEETVEDKVIGMLNNMDDDSVSKLLKPKTEKTL